MEKKKVNIGIQLLATLFIPTGLYAFKRINKLKSGSVVYVVSIGIAVIGTILGSLQIKMLLNISLISAIFSYLMPIAFMNKWCKIHNKEIQLLDSKQ